jgi:hypothetical protein
VTPDPVHFPPPWPAAIYGPGFTRSDYDLFVTADYNASLGIVTLATNPAGHGFGPLSMTTVTANGVPTTFLSYGRGRDLDGDGVIGDGLNDGVGPTGHVQPDGSELPSRKPIDGLASGLIQTVVDNMALGRALQAGLDVPGVGTNLVDLSRIMYYGLSFGGIYGTMLMGTDPLFHQGLLNVPGGPVVDIARLSSFRGDLANKLAISGRATSTVVRGSTASPRTCRFESIRRWSSRTPAPLTSRSCSRTPTGTTGTGAQRRSLRGSGCGPTRPGHRIPRISCSRWRTQTGPRRMSPRERSSAPVPSSIGSSSTATTRRDLFERSARLARGSKPRRRTDGEQQLGLFLSTGQLVNTNPAWLEVPIANPNNLECLHFPDPQTGQDQVRQPFPASGDCPPLSSDG